MSWRGMFDESELLYHVLCVLCWQGFHQVHMKKTCLECLAISHLSFHFGMGLCACMNRPKGPGTFLPFLLRLKLVRKELRYGHFAHVHVPLWRRVVIKHFTSVIILFFGKRTEHVSSTDSAAAILQGECDFSTSSGELCCLNTLAPGCKPFVLREQVSCCPFLCLSWALPGPLLHFTVVPQVCLEVASERCLCVEKHWVCLTSSGE